MGASWFLLSPNWWEADQLIIYKCHLGFELGTSVNKLNSAGSQRDDLNPGPQDYKGAFHLPELAGQIGQFVNGMRHFEGLLRQILRNCTF